MKIAIFEIKKWEKAHMKRKLKGHTLEFFSTPISEDNIKKLKSFDAISVFIYSQVDKKRISKLPKLKLIATRSTGFDHIDLKECKKKKITVCNVPFYGENTVAEHTFALVLSISRNIHKSYVRTLRNDFTIDGLIGFDLKGKTLGLIGGGHIGMHVARMAKGFGMEVLVHDTNKNNFLSEVLDFEYTDFDDLLKKSDIVTLHVPYNKHTHHLMNKKTFSLMKKGSILINTARGGVIDTDALIDALDKKILAGAGLDVLEGEKLIKEEKQLLHENHKTEALGELVKDHILLSKDNVVFTPHIAFYSKEALERILDTTILNISGFKNKKIKNVVA